MSSAANEIDVIVNKNITQIKSQMQSRGTRASKELMNAKNNVLRGKGGGRRYRIPNTGAYYTASAPGSPPASRTGAFRGRWEMKSVMNGDSEVQSQIESKVRTPDGKYLLGGLLEDGTSKMAPRPYQDKIREEAKPRVIAIFEEPYV